jgi:hypothetical protein
MEMVVVIFTKLSGAVRLVAEWLGVPEAEIVNHERIVGLVKALKPGVTSLTNVAKVAHSHSRTDATWKEKREALLAALLTEETRSEFGVWHD